MELRLYFPIHLQVAVLKEAWRQLLIKHPICLCKTNGHTFYTCICSLNHPKHDHSRAVTVTISGDSPSLQHYTMGILLCWTAAILLAVAPLLGWGRSVHCLRLFCWCTLHSFGQYAISENIIFTCYTALVSILSQKISFLHATQLWSIYYLKIYNFHMQTALVSILSQKISFSRATQLWSVHYLRRYHFHMLHSFGQHNISENITFTCYTALVSTIFQNISFAHAIQLWSVYYLRRYHFHMLHSFVQKYQFSFLYSAPASSPLIPSSLLLFCLLLTPFPCSPPFPFYLFLFYSLFFFSSFFYSVISIFLLPFPLLLLIPPLLLLRSGRFSIVDGYQHY
jgi:hypothetical protein